MFHIDKKINNVCFKEQALKNTNSPHYWLIWHYSVSEQVFLNQIYVHNWQISEIINDGTWEFQKTFFLG